MVEQNRERDPKGSGREGSGKEIPFSNDLYSPISFKEAPYFLTACPALKRGMKFVAS